MPDLSFVATANATMHAGATPIFVDIDPFNLCIDPAKIEAAITPRTKAIMPVHLYGHPADMRAINAIAAKHNLVVIEDAAEAHGSAVEGKRVGSWGFCATFSFYGNKNLTTGEGGMITTDDEAFYQKCRYLRDHAMSKEKRYWHTQLGYNYRMTNLQAALGCAQMERSEELLGRRKWVFDMYAKHLGTVAGLSLNRTNDWATNTYWLVCLEIDGATEDTRNAFAAALKERGVDTRPFFYPMSAMPYIKPQITQHLDTPVSYRVYQQGLNLPTFFELTEAQIAHVCESIKLVNSEK